MNKEKYIKYVNDHFTGKAKELLMNQIEMFYEKNIQIEKNQYVTGEDVFLKKGTFLHGIFGELENFDYTLENGFISVNFTEENRANKICNSVGMWNIKKDCYLKDYVTEYSGFTICYTLGRGPEAKTIAELIPYHQFDKVTERINNDESIWTYYGDKTKEVSFLPSLVSEKRQIAFILNTESEYAKKLLYADVFNLDFDDKTLKPFLDDRYYPKFLEERKNRNALTTDRESAIMFGLPIKLIEGIFVGRKIESSIEKLNYIKEKLPDCYICNLDGKVIVGNKK